MDESEPNVLVEPTNGKPRSLLELGLRGPTLGVLQRQGVLSVDQLTEMSPEHLMSLRRVGFSRMLEVRKALQAHGLDLQMSATDVPTRVWSVVQKIRLVCCEHGECSLEIRSAGVAPDQMERTIHAFVEAHGDCDLLDGRTPVAVRVESAHSLQN